MSGGMRKTNKVLGRSSWDALFSCLAPVTKHPYPETA
jgi:hypothetical protein